MSQRVWHQKPTKKSNSFLFFSVTSLTDVMPCFRNQFLYVQTATDTATVCLRFIVEDPQPLSARQKDTGKQYFRER